MATAVNAANLSPDFLASLDRLYSGTRLAAQELEGKLVEADGGLWTLALLARCRAEPPLRFDRVVIAVDPPAGQHGAACGVVAVGRWEGKAYVLADRTVRGLSPHAWAARVAAAVESFGANTVVAEANQGGEMVRSVLESAGVRVPIDMVHAQYGKAVRAEPVALLYEQGRVLHTDDFPQLEEELMSMGAPDPAPSPDRADALVWAVTDLLLDGDRWIPKMTVYW